MSNIVGRLLWKILDPLLITIRSRLEHLDLHQPSNRRTSLLRSMGAFSDTSQIFKTARIDNRAKKESLVVGEYSQIMGEILLQTEQALVVMGHHSCLGEDSRVWSSNSVKIGNYVLISHMVDVFDNNSHSLNHGKRRDDAIKVFELQKPVQFEFITSAPIVIEDDVWIGAKSTILKGVTIGAGAVVAAGSIVTKDVPPFTLVAGNPARIIKKIK
jgi:acetyltransferase-like isoleucine patch superfamily enzyme